MRGFGASLLVLVGSNLRRQRSINPEALYVSPPGHFEEWLNLEVTMRDESGVKASMALGQILGLGANYISDGVLQAAEEKVAGHDQRS
jgi:hypothetical protein